MTIVIAFDLESPVAWQESCSVFWLLRNFIFIGLAVVGTKFCLCSKVTDQCNRNCFYMGYYLFFSST